MLVRSLLVMVLLVPVVSAQLAGPGETSTTEVRQEVSVPSGIGPAAAPLNLAGAVTAQQRSWSRLLAAMNIGAASDLAEPVPAPLPAPAATPEPLDIQTVPVARPVDESRPLGGALTVSLPVATEGSPLVISRTPRREVAPTRSGTLRLSTAPTVLEPLAARTVRRLMDSTERLSLQSMVVASTRSAGRATALATMATPTRTPSAPSPAPEPAMPFGILREDGLASSLEGSEILCTEAPVWAPFGETVAVIPTCDELRDSLFRPTGTARQWTLLDQLGFEPSPAAGEADERFAIDHPPALHWSWDAETLLRLESMTDENNPFDGEGGRTFLLKIFPGL